jgi:hypothetical protein
MTDYQLIFWYALEIEHRQREYSRLVQAAGGSVCDVAAVDLRDPRRFVETAITLGLLSPGVDCDIFLAQHAANCAITWNQSSAPLRKYRGDLDAEEEEEVWQAIWVTDPQLRSSVELRYRGLSDFSGTRLISPRPLE